MAIETRADGSLPHRQLRKLKKDVLAVAWGSLPHRQLRNYMAGVIDLGDSITAA